MPSLFSGPQQLHSIGFAMTGEKDKRTTLTGTLGEESRQDRLKLALRENLKRRKSQARGRDEAVGASSETADASLDDAGGKRNQ